MSLSVVKSKWSICYPDPIIVKVGDIVSLGEAEQNEKWKGWIMCTFQNKHGWIPTHIIKFLDSQRGVTMENYSAQEVDVDIGDSVQVLRRLNGWGWVTTEKDNKMGWIPLECIE